MSEAKAAVAEAGTSERDASVRRMRVLSGVFLTLLLLAICTWGLRALRDLTQVRPYTILYLIPVALGAAMLGVRVGVGAALLALLLARLYLFESLAPVSPAVTALSVPERIEFIALACGTLTVAFVTGRLRSALGQLRASRDRFLDTNGQLQTALARLQESERERQAFNRDVLLAVTGGKLRLLEPEQMPPDDMVAGVPVLHLPLHDSVDASALRHSLRKVAREVGMGAEQSADLSTAVTEAATNAVKHANGGEARVWASDDFISVQVADQGEGIAPAQLARATLEQGYSTRVSLGMGFFLILQTVDSLALSTSPQGTTLLLQVSCHPRPTDRDSLLARYASL